METGTTAVHVSPGQEEAMRVAETFKRMAGDAADAIVNASKLSTDLKEMREQFEAFKKDLEATRQHNAELNGLLGDVRRQRDEAEQHLRQTAAELETGRRALEAMSHDFNVSKDRITGLSTDLDAVRKERDDNGYKVMELQEALDKANAKLGEIEEFAQRFMKPAAPTPKAPEMLPVTKEPDPEPIPHVRRAYEGDPEFSWTKVHKWDGEKNAWFAEVAA